MAGEIGAEQPAGERLRPVERADDRGMARPAVVGGEPVVERLPDEVVDERENAAAAGDHEPGRHRAVEETVDLGGRRRDARGEDLAVELATEDGRRGEGLDDRGGQLREPLAHRFPYPRGQRRDRAVGVPQASGLLDEERVAAGAPVHLVDKRVGGLATGRAGDQRAHLVAAEAGEGDRGGLCHQRHHQRAQRVVDGLDLGVAIGADEQQPLEPRVLCGELEQSQRGAVGPVEVVEDDNHRAALGDRDKSGGHGVVEAERLDAVVVVGRGVCGPVRLADQHRQVGPAASWAAAQSSGRAPQPAQHLHPRPVAGSAVGIPAGAADAPARPRRRASSAAPVTSVVLPMPGSPVTSTRPP